jgi:transketolase
MISYAAGHKALGLYTMWALRNEVARIAAPDLLPKDPRFQLRLEDLLGFRRNPVTGTPLFVKLKSKALDGHPTPATPFIKLSTGASGVGVASSLGLAYGARDYYGENAPRLHVIEGEGGLTPGRVAEALAAAGTACLDNAVIHLDWNQASIDTDAVCRDGEAPGEYVQWDPKELFYLHDWNVIYVADGFDYQQVIAAQRAAAEIGNHQPTAIVYRTVKGWKYGIEGRASHGAGHKLCSDNFFESMSPLLEKYSESLPVCCDLSQKRCDEANGDEVMEECFWSALEMTRRTLEREEGLVGLLAGRLQAARKRLDERGRKPRPDAPEIEAVYEIASADGGETPKELRLNPGGVTTLRAQLGKSLNYYNTASKGSVLVAAADLLGSTSVDAAALGHPDGFYNAVTNPGSRRLSLGGICEDAMAGILTGLSTYGHHIGVASSYGAFIAALGHIAARLHAIGSQARWSLAMEPFNPMMLVCAHAGLKTGEDGPTHADPQPLQLLQENFPRGTAITLTPWEPREVWPALSAALARRPALIAPFVTRPNEVVPEREERGLAPASAAAKGVYALRAANGKGDGTVVLQGSEVALPFVADALPRLEDDGIDLNVYYVTSAELFDLLPEEERAEIFPEERAREAMGITGFTLPTMYRWIGSDRGRAMTLHPFQKGHFLGSGPGDRVLEEAGLDAESQYGAIKNYLGKS